MLANSPQNIVTLTPVGMIRPTKECIYSPHPFVDPLTMSYAQFSTIWENTAQNIKVSFEPDLSNVQILPAYGLGMSHWYIIYNEFG